MTTDTVPTLSTVEEATALLNQLAADNDQVWVFWDRGWGGHGEPAEISIIAGDDGGNPSAHITSDVYRILCDRKTIAANSYGGFKKRRCHDFKAPPAPERPGPTSKEIAEKVIRAYVADNPTVPLEATFFRGLTGNAWSPIAEEAVTTVSYDPSWHILVHPGGSDVRVVAIGDVDQAGAYWARAIGDGTHFPYPSGADGALDEAALASHFAEAVLAQARVLGEARDAALVRQGGNQ